MRKLILVFAAIAITAGAYAQIDSTNRKLSHMDMNNNRNQNVHYSPVGKSLPDGVLMQNGIMMKVEDGELTILEDEMTMSNGTTITSDGNYIKSDGTELTLQEGEHMDLEGITTILNTDIDTSIDLNQKVQNNPVINSNPDGVMMQHGKMMKVENGRMTILEDEMTMSNGTKVMCDGNYIKEDGTKMMMEEGEHIDMAGNKSAIKTK